MIRADVTSLTLVRMWLKLCVLLYVNGDINDQIEEISRSLNKMLGKVSKQWMI